MMKRTWLRITTVGCLSGILAAQASSGKFSDQHVKLTFASDQLPRSLAERLAQESWQTAQLAIAKIKKAGLLPKKALHVRVYADVDAYRNAYEATRRPFFVEHFADVQTRHAHVTLWPELSEDVLKLTGLPADSRDGIILQLGVMAAAQTEVGAKDPWLCQTFAAGLLDAIDNPKLEPGRDLRFDGRRIHYLDSRREGHQSKLHDWSLITERPQDRHSLTRQWERAAWFSQVLALKTRSWPKKLLRKPRQVKGVANTTKVRQAIIQKLLGKTWGEIERRLDAVMAKATASTKRTTVGSMVTERDGRIVLAGTNEMGASVRMAAPSTRYVLRGKFQFADLPDNKWRLEFSGGEDGVALGVIFYPEGYVISSWKNKRWHEITKVESDGSPIAATEFAVEVSDSIKLRIGDRVVAECASAGHPMHEVVYATANAGLVWLDELRIENQ